MKRADKTLELIKAQIEDDQGARFRQYLGTLMPKMEDAYRGEGSPFRSHLGASLIGRDCARELWLSYHWATRKHHEDRILRLFNRGHLEEARFLAMLQCVPHVELWYETEDGGQFRFQDVEGHFGSALDGVVRGIPELPQGAPAYAEFKTSSDKVFQKVKKTGVQAEKYEHYVQMQICMHEMQLPFALYMMVNKNDDELHAEIIEYNQSVAVRYVDRARDIIYSNEPPPKINPSPGWYQCKWCDQHPVCHGKKVPEINCRTCAHSSPTKCGDGSWDCARGNVEIHTEQVYTGCADHVFNPHLLNGVTFHGGDMENNHTDITLPDGTRLLQGPKQVTSQQLKERGL